MFKLKEDFKNVLISFVFVVIFLVFIDLVGIEIDVRLLSLTTPTMALLIYAKLSLRGNLRKMNIEKGKKYKVKNDNILRPYFDYLIGEVVTVTSDNPDTPLVDEGMRKYPIQYDAPVPKGKRKARSIRADLLMGYKDGE